MNSRLLFSTVKNAAAMTVGLGAGIGFACNMDDVIYFQMKKNVMLPL
jgi:hypothetical protein